MTVPLSPADHATVIEGFLPPKGMTSIPAEPTKPADAKRAHEALAALVARAEQLQQRLEQADELLALYQDREGNGKTGWEARAEAAETQATLVAEQAESARALLEETTVELRSSREALQRIQAWDCLNPPDKNLCHDHPWLKRLVDDALAEIPSRPGRETAAEGFALIEKMADEAVATGYETREALAHALGLISGTALSRREALAGGDSR